MQNRQLIFRPKFNTNWPPSEARRLPIPCAFLKCGDGGNRTRVRVLLKEASTNLVWLKKKLRTQNQTKGSKFLTDACPRPPRSRAPGKLEAMMPTLPDSSYQEGGSP